MPRTRKGTRRTVHRLIPVSILIGLASGCSVVVGAEPVQCQSSADCGQLGLDGWECQMPEGICVAPTVATDSVKPGGDVPAGGAGPAVTPSTGGDAGADVPMNESDAGSKSCTSYLDTDNDGFGDDTLPFEGCDPPEGYVPNGGDCDDKNRLIFPQAQELCDGWDNDCDTTTDDECPVGCANASTEGHVYMVCSATEASYEVAVQMCTDQKMSLVFNHDAAEADRLIQLVHGKTTDGIWIDGTDLAQEGVWVRSNGDVFWSSSEPDSGNAPWAEGEPNNASDREDCLELRSSGLWNDAWCDGVLPFICERPDLTKLASTPSDASN